MDDEGNTIEDLLKPNLDEITRKNVLKLFEAAMKRKGTKDRKKAAIFVVNWNYEQHPTFDDLPGILEDVKVVKNIFLKRNYHLKVIKNSKDIESDVCNILDEEFKNCARDAFQFIYMGHGIHKVSLRNRKNSCPFGFLFLNSFLPNKLNMFIFLLSVI